MAGRRVDGSRVLKHRGVERGVEDVTEPGQRAQDRVPITTVTITESANGAHHLQAEDAEEGAPA